MSRHFNLYFIFFVGLFCQVRELSGQFLLNTPEGTIPVYNVFDTPIPGEKALELAEKKLVVVTSESTVSHRKGEYTTYRDTIKLYMNQIGKYGRVSNGDAEQVFLYNQNGNIASVHWYEAIAHKPLAADTMIRNDKDELIEIKPLQTVEMVICGVNRSSREGVRFNYKKKGMMSESIKWSCEGLVSDDCKKMRDYEKTTYSWNESGQIQEIKTEVIPMGELFDKFSAMASNKSRKYFYDKQGRVFEIKEFNYQGRLQHTEKLIYSDEGLLIEALEEYFSAFSETATNDSVISMTKVTFKYENSTLPVSANHESGLTGKETHIIYYKFAYEE